MTKAKTPAELIERANRELCKVKLRLKKGRETVYIRGTFPPKPGHGDRPKQYDIGTGLPATPDGIRIAKARAKQLEADVMLEKFSWEDYLPDNQKAEPTIEEWTIRFERAYWQKYERTVNRIDNYKTDYTRPYSFLPLMQPLSEKVLRRTLATFSPESRDRLRCYHAY